MTRRPTARLTTRRATAGATRRETRRDETRRDASTIGRRGDDASRDDGLVSSIRFDSNSIQIRFVTARPTATDSDDGPPPPPPRAGDDGRRSTSRTREVPNRGRRIERTIARASTSLSRRDAMTRCDVKGARRVPSALLEAVRFSPARARTSSPGFRRGARARRVRTLERGGEKNTRTLALGRESASSCRACWRCSTSTGRSPSLERNRTTS